MLKRVFIYLECSRVFSLPMTIMSWLIIFMYALLNAGNINNGILALIGISLVHLATNVLDDYFDYKSLIKQVNFDKKEYLRNSQKTKCRYLISGLLKESEIIRLISIYLFLACLIGLYLYINCGSGVLYFALAGGGIALVYSFMSKIRLSEFAIAIAYGPALFGGVYYVMTKTYSWEVFVLSIPSMFMTIVLLYIHTVMDYDYDLNEGHNTISNSFDSALDSLVVLKWFLGVSYLSLILLCIFDILDWQVFLVFLTIPLAVDLFNSMVEYTTNPESIPAKKWYHFPMENMMGAPNFMIRMYQSRNLMIYFSIILTISIVLALT